MSALADRATQTAYKQSSGGIVFRFLVRYFLMAAGCLCYIQCFSRESVWALCGPVPARRGHRVRSGLRVVHGFGARILSTLHAT